MRQVDLDSGRIEVRQADITTLQVDVIVTAANAQLAGGGGVDGAVHQAAGPRLLQACRKIGGCDTGSAVITMGYDLQDRGVQYVIHAVGPIWRGGEQNEEARLAEAYAKSLELADTHECQSVAFPSISTGVYGFPVERAAKIAITDFIKFLTAGPTHLRRIVASLFDARSLAAFEQALDRKASDP